MQKNWKEGNEDSEINRSLLSATNQLLALTAVSIINSESN